MEHNMSFDRKYNIDEDLSETGLVTGVKFSVYGANEALGYSVVPITSSDMNEGTNPNIPKCNGVNDPRMGPLSNQSPYECPTDRMDYIKCPGYFGHIQLAKPVYWIHYLDYVIKILRFTCINCGSLLIDKTGNTSSSDYQIYLSSQKLKKKYRWLKFQTIKPKKICHECQMVQPNKYTKESTVGISGIVITPTAEFNSTELTNGVPKKMVFSAEKIMEIFSMISDEDVEIMGFDKTYSRPEQLICAVFPVPPPCVRPSILNEGSQRSIDDLTHKILDICKTNELLEQRIENNSNKDNIYWYQELLQYHAATYVNNDINSLQKAKRRSGGHLKSVTSRLRGKEGRCRHNLMGKRVNYSARTVITPDPMLSIDEVGCPEKIARELNYPEVVTKYNIERLTKIVQNGPNKYPGAKCYIPAKNVKRDGILTCNNNMDLRILEKQGKLKDVKLQIGDVVRRHLIDGDHVLFNRQPSLHKMSMMTHKVRVLPYNTFRIQLAVCEPYNADFDGDEMNLFLPQGTIPSREIQDLCSVPLEIVSPQHGKPLITITYDGLMGAYLMTKDDTYLTKKQVMNTIVWNDISVDKLPIPKGPNGLYTGKQIFSLILPNINYTRKVDDGNDVIIKNGELISGCLGKVDLGDGLIKRLFNDYGHEQTKIFLDSEQRMAIYFLTNFSSFTIGIGDCIIDEEDSNRIKGEISKQISNSYKLIHQAQEGVMKLKLKTEVLEDFELQISQILDSAKNSVGSMLDKGIIKKENRFYQMGPNASGSKGKKDQIVQSIGCIGQQNVAIKQEDGSYRKQRLACNYGMKAGGCNFRTLPIVARDDDSALARGFIANNYMDGINPIEFWASSVSGREGLMDTALKTADTGYFQRKLVKTMEDNIVAYDGTVRNSQGNIIQFLYGSDGMHPAKLEKDKLEILCYNNDEMRDKFRFYNEDWNKLVSADIKKYITSKSKEFNEIMDAEYEKLIGYRDLLRNKIFANPIKNLLPMYIEILFPFNLRRIISNTQTIIPNVDNVSDIHPKYIIDEVDNLMNRLNLFINIDNPIKKELEESHKLLYRIKINTYLTPKRVIKEYKLNKLEFDHIIKEIENQFIKSLVQPGEVVGPLAGQCIGKPSTQMTLDTFHSSGKSENSNLTTGMPRVREIIQVSKTPKGTKTQIFLKSKYRYDIKKAEEIKNNLTQTSLKDITVQTQILFQNDETNDDNDNGFNDNELLASYNKFMNVENVTPKSPWVLRITLDKWTMLDRGLNMYQVYDKINDKFGNLIECIFTDDNSENLILRLKVNISNLANQDDSQTDEYLLLKNIDENLIESIYLSGISGISNAYIDEFKERPAVVEYTENGDMLKVQYVDPENGDYRIKENPDPNGKFELPREIVINAIGSNLEEILSMPEVDITRTMCNNVTEIQEVFGIETAREMIIRELYEILTFSERLDIKHLSLLVDTMINKGNIMSVDRFGISSGGDNGVLARSSFEETEPQFTKAAVHTEVDNMQGVSANIMLGQLIKGGTGAMDVLLDEEMLLQNTQDYSHQTIEEVVEEVIKQDNCDNLNFGIDIDFNKNKNVNKQLGDVGIKVI